MGDNEFGQLGLEGTSTPLGYSTDALLLASLNTNGETIIDISFDGTFSGALEGIDNCV